MANENNNSDKRGFASMDPEKQREIASQGGKSAHANGNAHEWDSDEARAAGREGGKASHKGDSKDSENTTELTDTPDMTNE